jgi:hypothetical protein
MALRIEAFALCEAVAIVVTAAAGVEQRYVASK